MSTVTANGCAFHVRCEGAGRDIVFVHGEIHGTVYWEHQWPEFTRDHRCLAYDRRGHAGTQWTDYGFSLVNQTRDLEALIAHHGIERPVIVAVAFGAAIAAQYAIWHPERVRGLVMVAWSELHDALKYFDRWARASAQVVRILETDGREALVEFLRREGGRSVYLVIPLDSPIREKCVRMFAQHPLEQYRRGMLEFATSVPDLVTPFRALDVPVLGVCGADDPFPDQPQVLAGMRRFREAPMIPGAGRFANWEQPAAFNRVVREFIEALP